MQDAREIRVEKSPSRCPYCHDGIGAADLEASIVCQVCLSRHHRDCWQGGCASCKSTKPLAAATGPVGDATTRYERTKRRLNQAYALGWVLCMVLAINLPGETTWVVETFAAFALVVTALDIYDAVVRYSRDRSSGFLSVATAVLGLATAGVTGFAYYLGWGWRPLPPKRPAKPPAKPPSDAKIVKGE